MPKDFLYEALRELPKELLSAEDEVRLGTRAHAGDVEAREELILKNRRLVITMAKKFQGKGLPLEDLIQEGNIGLMRATTGFNPEEFNVRFSTYASFWIKQSIRRALINTAHTIRLPNHVYTLISHVRKASAALRAEGIEPTPEQSMQIANITEKQQEMLKSAEVAQNFEEQGDWGMAENLSSHDDIEDRVIRNEEFGRLSAAMEKVLDHRERLVIRMRFGLDGEGGITLKDAGQVLGCTREWVRKIEERALEKLSKAC